MNALMTKSTIGYVKQKKQVLKDIETEADLEITRFDPRDDEQILLKLFEDITLINNYTREITNLQLHLHDGKVVNSIRDQINSDLVTILGKAKNIKTRLESLDNVSTMIGLRVKLRDMMIGFQSLGEKLVGEEETSEESMEKTCLKEVQHVFLDMAVLIERRGKDQIDDIENNVAHCGINVNGGTNGLIYAKQMKEKRWNWVCWIGALVLLLLLAWIIISVI